MSTSAITSKVRELKELKAMLEEIEAEIDTIEDEIKAELPARNTEEMSVDVYQVRWPKVTSSRFDTSAFKKTHAELYNQYTKQTETRRFCVA